IARGMDKASPAAPPPAAEAQAGYGRADGSARQQLGTGHGEREWSPAGQTVFARASRRPAQLSQLRYDSPGALAARGIVPRPRTTRQPHRPRAFPGAFVPDPPPAF